MWLKKRASLNYQFRLIMTGTILNRLAIRRCRTMISTCRVFFHTKNWTVMRNWSRRRLGSTIMLPHQRLKLLHFGPSIRMFNTCRRRQWRKFIKKKKKNPVYKTLETTQLQLLE
jgi:hypothetical protein